MREQGRTGYGNKQNNSKIDEKVRSTAPYNFIPIDARFTKMPYKDDCVKHEVFYKEDPNGVTRYTGKITYELETLTEVFVGGDKKNIKGHHLFFQDDRNFIIPGSTIRGLVRSNAAILSFASPEFIDDKRFMYRSFADKSKAIRNQYMDVMRGSNGKGQKQSFNKAIKAGYFYWATKDKLCCIPAPEFGESGRNYVKVHEKDLRKNNILSDDTHYMYTTPILKYGEYLERKGYKVTERTKNTYLREYQREINKVQNKNYVPYGNNPYRSIHVTFNYYNEKVCNLNSGLLDGILLNSEHINGKTSHYLVNYYKKEELESRTDALTIDSELVQSFEQDLERNQIQNRKLKQGFYNLPYDKNGKKLIGIEHAKLFFYGQYENGEVFGFGATPYFRIFHKHSVLDGYRGKNDKVDWVQSMFGYTDDGKNGKSEQDHYEGRVSFSNCIMTKHGNRLSVPRKILLAGPKPTAPQMYLDQTDKKVENLNTYSADSKDYALRGRKFYWKRNQVSIPVEHSRAYEWDEELGKTVPILPKFKIDLLNIEGKLLTPEEEEERAKEEQKKKEATTMGLLMEHGKESAKQIHKKHVCSNVIEEKTVQRGNKKENDNVKTTIIPVLPYQTFYGEVYFENLSIEELGLLLMAIKKNKNSSDSIGSGKPYGFGKVHFKGIKVYCEDKQQSFLQIAPKMASEQPSVHEAKCRFVAWMDRELQRQYNQEASIKLFRMVKLQTGVTDDTLIDYMGLKQYKERCPLVDAFDLLNCGEVRVEHEVDEVLEEKEAKVVEVDLQPAKQETLDALVSQYRNNRKNNHNKKHSKKK